MLASKSANTAPFFLAFGFFYNRCILKPCRSSDCDAPGDLSAMPVISLSEVREHDSVSKGVWVTYGDGVYDITNFINKHPGGQAHIMQAAGKSVMPFWQIHRQHYKSRTTMDTLAAMRIGTLDPNDSEANPQTPVKEINISQSRLPSPSAAGLLPDELDDDFKERMYELRRNIWVGGLQGLFIGVFVGYSSFFISKIKRFQYLKWGKTHRMGSILLFGSIFSFIGAVGTGKSQLGLQHDIPLLIKPNPSSNYRQIMNENLKEDLENIEMSYNRRAKAIGKLKNEK